MAFDKLTSLHIRLGYTTELSALKPTAVCSAVYRASVLRPKKCVKLDCGLKFRKSWTHKDYLTACNLCHVICLFRYQTITQTLSGGSLGSWVDEERSKLRADM